MYGLRNTAGSTEMLLSQIVDKSEVQLTITVALDGNPNHQVRKGEEEGGGVGDTERHRNLPSWFPSMGKGGGGERTEGEPKLPRYGEGGEGGGNERRRGGSMRKGYQNWGLTFSVPGIFCGHTCERNEVTFQPRRLFTPPPRSER
jgi:hypothetical protein